jgi:anaerobic magnesium-protoporphyrin IX monomethyl ester cyclase
MGSNGRKILFVTPPYHCGVVEVAGSWPPLGFLTLAAQAERAGGQAEI